MDELLQKALEQRERLRAELEAVDRFIASYSVLRDRPSSAPLFGAGSSPRASRSEKIEAVRAMLADAERMILDEGRPLTRSELLERLTSAGHKLEGGDRSKVLGTNLWRSDKFWNLKGAGYWPKLTPVPQRFKHLARRPTVSGN